jgi:hypothetical protein
MPLTAAEPAGPALSQADRDAIGALFASLRDVFLAGNHRELPALLAARENAEEERGVQITQTVRRDFKSRSYVEFDVRDWSVEEVMGTRRLDLWVSLRTVYVTPDKIRMENSHNDLFLVERQTDGRFLLVDSPFFLTLGQQQGVGLIADALLAAIGCLMGLTFWVWMGFEAFTLRPRRPAWRAVVMLLPLLGALAFFLFCYVPGWFRGPRETVEEKARSGLTNHV